MLDTVASDNIRKPSNLNFQVPGCMRVDQVQAKGLLILAGRMVKYQCGLTVPQSFFLRTK